MQRHVGPPEIVKDFFLRKTILFLFHVYSLCVQQCRVIERKISENSNLFLFISNYMYFKNSENVGSRSYP